MLHRSRASVLALAALLLVGSATRGEEKRVLDATELGRTLLDLDGVVDVNETLDQFAERLGARYVRGYGIEGMKIKLHLEKDGPKLTWGAFKRILDASQVVILEERVQGELLVLSVHRNSMNNYSSTTAAIVTGTSALPGREEWVTAIVPLERASAMEVYNIVRYLDSWSPSRRGVVMLAPSSNSIVIHELASTVGYLRKVAETLDAPSELPSRVLPVRAADARSVAAAIGYLYPRTDTRVDVCAVGSSVAVRGPSERLASIEKLVSELEAAAK